MIQHKGPRDYKLFYAHALMTFISLCLVWFYTFHTILLTEIIAKNDWNVLISISGIVCITLHLIYYKRKKLTRVIPSTSPLALLCLLCLSLGFVLAKVYGLTSVMPVAILLMLPAFTLLCFGPAVITILIFPLSYFLLVLLVLLPEFTDGYYLYWLAVALWYGYLNYTHFLRLTLLAMCSIGLPFLKNVILNEWFLTHAYFIYIEWLSIAVTISVLWLIAFCLQEPRSLFISSISPLEFERKEARYIKMNERWLSPSLIAFLIILSAPWLADNIRNLYVFDTYQEKIALPKINSQWQGPIVVTGNAWKPRFCNASQIVQGIYEKQEPYEHNITNAEQNITQKDFVYLYSVYYNSALSSNHLFEKNNQLYDPAIWKEISSTPVSIQLPNKKTLHLTEHIVQAQDVTRIIWSWQHMQGFELQNTILYAMLDPIRLIAKDAVGSGLIMVSKQVNHASITASRQELQFFIESGYPFASLKVALNQ